MLREECNENQCIVCLEIFWRKILFQMFTKYILEVVFSDS